MHAWLSCGGRQIKVTSTPGGKADCWSVDSICTSGVSIEVGPIPLNTIRLDQLEHTRTLVTTLLDLIEQRNQLLLTHAAGPDACIISVETAPAVIGQVAPFPSLTTYVSVEPVLYPAPYGWCLHPDWDGPNFRPVRVGDPIFVATDGSQTTAPFAGPKTSVPTSAELVTVFANGPVYPNVAFIMYHKKSACVW
jgi:hypothetical protein